MEQRQYSFLFLISHSTACNMAKEKTYGQAFYTVKFSRALSASFLAKTANRYCPGAPIC
jgi:hypothetical protein